MLPIVHSHVELILKSIFFQVAGLWVDITFFMHAHAYIHFNIFWFLYNRHLLSLLIMFIPSHLLGLWSVQDLTNFPFPFFCSYGNFFRFITQWLLAPNLYLPHVTYLHVGTWSLQLGPFLRFDVWTLGPRLCPWKFKNSEASVNCSSQTGRTLAMAEEEETIRKWAYPLTFFLSGFQIVNNKTHLEWKGIKGQ